MSVQHSNAAPSRPPISHVGEFLNPSSINTPLTVLTAVAVFCTTAEGGVFRFSNLFGNALIAFSASISTGLSYSLHDHENAAKMGMLAGFLTVGLAEVRMVRPVLPRKWNAALGLGYMAYHGMLYRWETTRFEDAGED